MYPELSFVLVLFLALPLSYIGGMPIFLLTAKLKRRHDGTLVINHKSWHFKIAYLLVLDEENSDHYKRILASTKAKRVGICEYYFKFYFSCSFLLISVITFCLAWTGLFLFNFVSILVAGYTFTLRLNNFGQSYAIPLPRLFGYRIWPIVYIVLGALAYYRPSISIPVILEASAWLLVIAVFIAVITSLSILIVYFIKLFRRKEGDVPLAVEWIKAKFRKLCPYAEVE